MLTEDSVIKAVCRDLQRRGYETEFKTTKQRGVDITATNGRATLLIEAKGATSNLATSRNYGKPFTRKQCYTHVSVAFFAAASLAGQTSRTSKSFVAIALPDNDHHQQQIAKIAHALRALDIGVIWVRSERSVRYEARWAKRLMLRNQ